MPGNGSFDINVDGNTVVKGEIKSLIIALIIEYDEETTVTHTVKSDKTMDRKRQKALYESFESFRQAIKTNENEFYHNTLGHLTGTLRGNSTHQQMATHMSSRTTQWPNSIDKKTVS